MESRSSTARPAGAGLGVSGERKAGRLSRIGLGREDFGGGAAPGFATGQEDPTAFFGTNAWE